MAQRTCTVGLVITKPLNAVLTLTLVSSHTSEGKWSDGAQPPQTIGPSTGGAGQWETQSTAAPIHGTGGNLEYKINDEAITFNLGGGNLASGKGNSFTITWSNPIIGPPSIPSASFTSGGDIYAVTLASASSGGQNELGDFLVPVVGPVNAFLGEVDNPLFVLQLGFANNAPIRIPGFSMRRAFPGKNLGLGVRALATGVHGPISARVLMGFPASS